LPECWLFIVHNAAKRDGILNESAVVPALGTILAIREEGEPAPRDPACLLGHELVGFAACGERHFRHPRFHRSAELYLRRVRADCFGLQIEQNEPGDGAIRHAYEIPIPMSSRFNEKSCAVPLSAPQRLLDAFVGQ